MAYRHLVEVAHVLLEVFQVVEVEVVTGIHAQSAVVSSLCGSHLRSHSLGRVFLKLYGIRAGV